LYQARFNISQKLIIKKKKDLKQKMRLLSQQPAAQDFRQSNITFQHRVLRTTAALTLLPLLHPPFAPRAAVLWRGRNFAGFLVVKTLSALGRVLRVGSTPA